ncbi:MAG: hypothetical protein ABEK84_05375 [Salinibacter sp.]
MFELDSNQTLLLSCLIVLIGVGTYFTYFRQRSTIRSLNQKIESKRQKREKIKRLRTTLTEAKSKLETVRRRWRTRYKKVPDTISSASVVGYLTELTQTGFKTFNISSGGTEVRDGYSVYTFSAEGKAFFTNLYRFVWMIENNRPFYRVRNLELAYLQERKTNKETGRTTMDVLVSFQMDVQAIYGATRTLEGGDALTEGREVDRLPVAQTAPRPPLPSSVLPTPAPEVNPFYPVVFKQIPPNEYGRLNVESAQLLSIIDDEAIFQTGSGLERVQEGDRVYLGRIVEIDPRDGRVVARLNKGGIVERVALSLQPDSPLQQGGQGEGTEAGGQ